MAEIKKVTLDTEALSRLIAESGILNPKVKVADLMSKAQTSAGMVTASGGVKSDAGDFYISPSYVCFHVKE